MTTIAINPFLAKDARRVKTPINQGPAALRLTPVVEGWQGWQSSLHSPYCFSPDLLPLMAQQLDPIASRSLALM